MKSPNLMMLCVACFFSSCGYSGKDKPDVVYTCDGDGSPCFEISLDLNRAASTEKLQKLLAELFEKFPEGASPNPAVGPGTKREVLVVNRRNRTIRFEILPILRQTRDSLSSDERAARALFVDVRKELSKIVGGVLQDEVGESVGTQ